MATQTYPINLKDAFTEREIEISRMLASGCSDANIAFVLQTTQNNVRQIIYQMCQKAGTTNRTQLIGLMVDLQLIRT